MFCMGRPICRPEHGPSRKAPRADTQVRPYAMGEVFRTNEIRCGNGPCPVGGGTEPAPYGCAAGSAQQRADVPRAWLPPAKFRNGIWGVSHRHRPLRPAEGGRGTARRGVVPYGWLRRAAAIALASGAQRSICGAVARSGLESEQRPSPKGASNFGQSLSHGEAVTAPVAVPKILCSHALTEF